MKEIKTFLFLLIFALIQNGLNANNEDTVKLSLVQAQNYALEHSLTVKDAKLDASIAKRRIAETRAIGLPQVNASAGYQYNFKIPTSLVPAEFFGGPPGEFAEIQFGTEQNLSANLNVNQLIFDGSYFVGLKAAKIYRDIANKNIAKSEIEIKTSVAQTYFLALITSENINILEQNIANMEKTKQETQKLFEAGFTDHINKEQIKLAVSRLQNMLSNLERQRTVTHNLLKFQIGMKMEEKIHLTDDLNELILNIKLETLSSEKFNPTNHIDYQVVLAWESMQEMNLKREKSAFYPSLSGNYVYQQSAMRNEFNFLDTDESWFPASFFGINLNVPIFSSGMRRSKVQQAKLELDKARLATYQTKQSVELQFQEALSEFNSALEKYQNDKENLELAERILERTNIMHKEGLATSLELTQANDQVLDTQSEYLRSIFELLNAKNEFDKAMGMQR